MCIVPQGENDHIGLADGDCRKACLAYVIAGDAGPGGQMRFRFSRQLVIVE